MKDNELRTVSDADYRRLMSEAYPSPKKDIRAAVMTQIAEETAQSEKKAKILTPAFRKRFVRYGSIAACLVLLVTLGFRVLPMMTKDAVMESAVNTTATQAADTDGFYADEAVPETKAASAGGSGILKSKLSGSAPAAPAEKPAEAEMTEEEGAVMAYSAVLTDSAEEDTITEEAVEEAPMLMMCPTPAAEEAPVEECAAEEAIEECIVEEAPADNAVSPISLFESELKLALTGEISAEAYTAWLTDRGYTSAEDWSIPEFVQNFGIPRERFTDLYTALTAFFTQNNPDAEIISYNLSELYPA